MSTSFDSDATFSTKAYGFTSGHLFLVLVWPVLVLAAGAVVAHHYWQELVEEQSLRPRIAVLDVEAIVTSTKGAATDEASYNRAFEKVNETAAKLREAGFLVIDRRSVRSAPDAVLVPSP